MNRPTLRRHNAAGFTMLEALITAASISALIVMVVPGIQRTRETAQAAGCANNLQQIYRAAQSFKADQIHQSGGGSDVLAADAWRATLAPFIGNSRAFDCPGTTSDSSPDALARAQHEIAEAPITPPDSAPPGSTCGPACLTCQSGLAVIAATQTTGRTPSDYALTGNLAKVNGRSHEIFGMDYLTETVVSTDDWNKAPFDAGAGNPPTFARHKGHFNVLYGDGSVRPVSTEGHDLSPSSTSPDAKRFWKSD